jgi:hypothetical protein
VNKNKKEREKNWETQKRKKESSKRDKETLVYIEKTETKKCYF